MLRVKFIRALLVALCAIAPATAQSASQWDFLSDASVFRDVHGMLGAYLKQRAFVLLDERARVVSRISTRADLTARQQYVRERMWSYLGGRPERTPLNARVVGVLDIYNIYTAQAAHGALYHFWVIAIRCSG